MSLNTIFFGWNRPLPGRENLSREHFGELVGWLEQQKSKGVIESFQPVFLEAHGGDMNGFFLIQGDPGKLDTMCGDDEWATHMTRAAMHLESAGYIRGVSGDKLMKRFELWAGQIP